ncbi:CYTH domain-containing protein [Pseudoduganella plicata]|uniref:CYTH domain-containing protein n=1 Tax=Pseudoduganella plicata TaxID=321984 RepID=A0AA87Y5C4_9BURK|nr:CYTH domain-containing protein [Pseudoduganella plicata]GGY77402.1 CYTH domain-containing protein [Pseudoduganella plicata]
MGVEIEHKFLVRGDAWKAQGEPVLIRQGYLSSHPERVVRVRIYGDEAFMTIKTKTASALSRGEWEYPLPLADAQEFLDRLCERPIIEKYRRRIEHGGFTWEVDEFLGANAGLVVAEIEVPSEDQAFERPDWVGDEVTDDSRYLNSNLISHPFSAW